MAHKNPWHGTEGFWISPTGDFKEVAEHFNEVKGDPGSFGFSAAEAQAWDRKDRDKVLVLVMKKGFIRVRGHRDYTTFELWKVSDQAIGHMKKFVDKFSFYPDEEVSIHEISSHEAWSGTIRKLKYLSADRFREAKV